MRTLILAATLLLTGCVGSLTPHQSMFSAVGMYDSALTTAVAYSEGPTADPAVVHRLNEANKAVQPAVVYARSYTKCLGSNATVTPGIDCRSLDFRAEKGGSFGRFVAKLKETAQAKRRAS